MRSQAQFVAFHHSATIAPSFPAELFVIVRDLQQGSEPIRRW